MTNEQAKKNIEAFAEEQKAGETSHCPRCGGPMKEKLHTNALSRRADVMICDRCGVDEALLDATGGPPLSFRKWAINSDVIEHAKLCASLNIQIAMLKKIEHDEKEKFIGGVTENDVEKLRSIVTLLNDAIEIKTGQRVGE